MKPLLLRLKGYPKTEGRLRASALRRLESAAKREPELAGLWKTFRRKRPAGMRRADYVKMRVLHRQFEGERPTGLPTLVRAARFLVKKMRWRRARG